MSALALRFETVESSCMGGKVRTWRNHGMDSNSPGEFLARLWTLFGPPCAVDDGEYSYFLRDRQTRLRFDVYYAAVRAVTKVTASRGVAVLGVENGYTGLIEGRFRSLTDERDGVPVPDRETEGGGTRAHSRARKVSRLIWAQVPGHRARGRPS